MTSFRRPSPPPSKIDPFIITSVTFAIDPSQGRRAWPVGRGSFERVATRRAGCGPFRYPAWRGLVAVKCATDPITSTSTVWNDSSRISRSPSAVSPRLSKSPFRLKDQRIARACSVCRPAVPRPCRRTTPRRVRAGGGDVPDRDGLLRTGVRASSRVVTSLAPVRRIVAIHLPLALPGDNL